MSPLPAGAFILVLLIASCLVTLQRQQERGGHTPPPSPAGHSDTEAGSRLQVSWNRSSTVSSVPQRQTEFRLIPTRKHPTNFKN